MAKEKTLKDNIYNSILEGIIDYEYVPNQIITEKEMVQKYGCSKSPIREALIALCTDGVLRSIPRCGYEIIQLTVDDIRNIQNYRLVLECGMLRFYYNKVTDQQLNRLRPVSYTHLDVYKRQMFKRINPSPGFPNQLPKSAPI